MNIRWFKTDNVIAIRPVDMEAFQVIRQVKDHYEVAIIDDGKPVQALPTGPAWEAVYGMAASRAIYRIADEQLDLWDLNISK